MKMTHLLIILLMFAFSGCENPILKSNSDISEKEINQPIENDSDVIELEDEQEDAIASEAVSEEERLAAERDSEVEKGREILITNQILDMLENKIRQHVIKLDRIFNNSQNLLNQLIDFNTLGPAQLRRIQGLVDVSQEKMQEIEVLYNDDKSQLEIVSDLVLESRDLLNNDRNHIDGSSKSTEAINNFNAISILQIEQTADIIRQSFGLLLDQLAPIRHQVSVEYFDEYVIAVFNVIDVLGNFKQQSIAASNNNHANSNRILAVYVQANQIFSGIENKRDSLVQFTNSLQSDSISAAEFTASYENATNIKNDILQDVANITNLVNEGRALLGLQNI